jgi:DNA-binding response OmpR family regulator
MVRTVLVSASDPSMLDDATGVLLRQRYRCLVARTSTEALAGLRASRIDLLVADAALPGLASLLRRAADDPRLHPAAILVVGGGEGLHDEFAFLPSPFNADRFAQTVTAMIGPARMPTLENVAVAATPADGSEAAKTP